MKVYSVVFKANGKNYYFKGTDEYKINDYVVVETDKGLQYGRIFSIVNTEEDLNKYKNIVRKANASDTKEYYNSNCSYYWN